MKYPIIQIDKARDWWFDWRAKCEEAGVRDKPPAFDDIEYVECPGNSNPEEEMTKLVATLSRLYKAVDGTARSLDTDRFEAKAAELMHRELTESQALADPGFWIWCAVSAGADLVERRYPSKAKDGVVKRAESLEESEDTRGEGKNRNSWIPDRANFFSASARETFFYRLWIRGRLGYVEGTEDPYELARCGDVDFWRSHIFRQMSLEAEALRVEFIRFQFPDGADGKPRLSQNMIRLLIKMLRRAAANVVVDGFDKDQAREFIQRQWQVLEKQKT